MAQDLDSFLLEYRVDLRDSLDRLTKLQEKMDKTKKASDNASSGVKDFASGAADKLDKLVPGVNAVAGAVRGLGAEFVAAGVAVGVMSIAVKSLMTTQKLFNEQRNTGLASGFSSARVADYQSKYQNGRVSRDQVSDQLKKLRDMSNDAYMNPMDYQKRALMGYLGIDPGSKFDGKGATGSVEELTQLAKRLQGMDGAGIKALSGSSGLDFDFLNSVKSQGVGGAQNITTMNADQVKQYNEGQGNVSKLNADLQEWNKQMITLETTLGEDLLPLGSKFLEWLTGMVQTIEAVVHVAEHPIDALTGKGSGTAANGKKMKTVDDGMGGTISIIDDSPDTSKDTAERKRLQDAANKADQADQSAANQNVTAASQMAASISMFGAAVGTFSDVIDSQQAAAAWAGDIGNGAGIKGASSVGGVMSGGGNGDWKSSPYASQIQAAATAKGVDPQLLYATMMTESHGKNGQYSETGAGGLMQVTRGNWRKLGGGADVMDPGANIMVGAQILKESIGRAHGDIATGLGYYNGNSDPNYVSKVGMFYGGKGIGQSRDGSIGVQGMQAFNSVAQFLKVDPKSLMQGAYGKGDALYGIDNLEAQYLNSSQQARMALKNPSLTVQDRSNLQAQLQNATQGLSALQSSKSSIIGRQKQDGETFLTKSRRDATMAAPITTNNFYINGTADARQIAKEVDERLNHHMQSALNSVQTQEKG
jgi:hypothetical protein